MARVLFHSPQLAVVDEISSAVDLATERRFYDECRRRGVTLLSIGHRPSLREYHSVIYIVEEKGLRKLSDDRTLPRGRKAKRQVRIGDDEDGTNDGEGSGGSKD